MSPDVKYRKHLLPVFTRISYNSSRLLIPTPGVIMDDVDSSMDIDTPEGVDNSTNPELPSHHSQGSTANYTEAQHRQMDNAVAKQLTGDELNDWRQGASIGNLSIVLQSVVLSDNRLNRKYRDLNFARDLLKKDRLLRPVVAGAWKAGSYRDLRELGTARNYL